MVAMIAVWRCRHEQCSVEQLARFQDWLTPEEAVRRARYRRPQDQLRFLVGRGMLRSLLEHYTELPASKWRFELGPYGRPEPCFENVDSEESRSSPKFSLSHSRGTSIAAFSTEVEKVGADVEARNRTTHWDLASRFFAPAEAATVEEAVEQERGELFLRFWTLKEAYVKAVGQGISLGLDTFAFRLSPDSPPEVEFVSPDEEPARWHFYEQPWHDEQVAVAAQCSHRPELEWGEFLQIQPRF